MAAPHVAGVVALLLDAEPGLRGDTAMIKAIVSGTSEPVIDYACGAEVGGQPNNRFGWGIVNARRAIESLSQTGFLAGAIYYHLGSPVYRGPGSRRMIKMARCWEKQSPTHWAAIACKFPGERIGWKYSALAMKRHR